MERTGVSSTRKDTGRVVVPNEVVTTKSGKTIKLSHCYWQLELSEHVHCYLSAYGERLRFHLRRFRTGEFGNSIHTTAQGVIMDADQTKELTGYLSEAVSFVVGNHAKSKVR